LSNKACREVGKRGIGERKQQHESRSPTPAEHHHVYDGLRLARPAPPALSRR
jgi:hypothetical protein